MLVPSFLDILNLQLLKRTGTGCGLQRVQRRGGRVIDPLWHMYTLDGINAETVCYFVKSKIWSI